MKKVKKARNKLLPVLLIVFMLAQILGGVLLAPPIEKSLADAPTDWLDGWDYRTPIEIDGNTEDLTDYQVQITLQGTNSSAANYVDFDKVLTGGADIRFTDDDKITEIDFWIEEWVDTSGLESAIVWVEVPSLLTAGTKTVYVYYGKAGVSSGSDGDGTFEFFDDFEEGIINYSSGSWTTKTPMTYASADVPVVVYDSKLYAFGGYQAGASIVLNYTQIYDPSINSWSQGTVMPTARWGAAAAEYDGIVYVFSGYIDPTTGTNVTEAYNISENSWSAKTNIPASIAHQGLMAVTVGTKIYLFYKTYTYEFDPTGDGGNGTYTQKTNMPVSKTWGTCAYINVSGEDRIYIIGGWGGSAGTNTNYYYDVSGNSWSSAQAAAPYASWGHTRESCVIDGQIYYTHGQNPGGTYFTYAYRYDPSENTWSSALTHATYARDGTGSGVINDKLYVIGGRVGAVAYDYNEEFDPATNSQESLDLEKWNISQNSGSHSISNNIITLSGNAGGGWYQIAGRTGFSPEVIMRMKNKFEVTIAADQITQAGWSATDLSYCKNTNDFLSFKGTHYVECGDGINYALNNVDASHFGDWYVYEIIRLGTSTKFYKDGILINNCAYDLDGNRFPHFAVRDSEYQIHSDWILIRNYTSTKPTTATTSAFRGYNKIFTGITNTISATDYVSYSAEPTVSNLVNLTAVSPSGSVDVVVTDTLIDLDYQNSAIAGLSVSNIDREINLNNNNSSSMTITLASGSIDTSITTWNTSGTYYKKWMETGDGSTGNTTHTIGDLKANTYYTVKVDATRFNTYLSNSSGEISFTYTGGYSSHEFEIEEDTTGPTVSLSTPSNNSSTGDNTPTLTWSASDSESGIAKYQLYIDGSLDTDNISSSATSVEPANNLSCGNHTWYVKAIDNAGNSTNSSTFNLTMACASGLPPSASNPPALPEPDSENPEGGFGVLINNGDEYTNSETVTLKLYAGPDTARMAISNTEDFEYASQVSFREEMEWDLSSGRDEEYTVYAKFYTQYGVASEVVSDSIILKTATIETEGQTEDSESSKDSESEKESKPETGEDKDSESFNDSESDETEFAKQFSTVFTKTLEFNSNNDQVIQLQNKLKELEFFPEEIKPNGNFGPATEQAVIEYQKSKGIYPCGIVGPRTRKALNDEEFITNKDHQFTQDLKYNDKNEEVKQLQTRLRDQNFFPYNVKSTGWFGSITQKAVKFFQEFYNLIQSGIVDSKMREVLNR